jgi:PleD family two-component response regulator
MRGGRAGMSALVLVADADPFNLRLLSELCGTLGYDVMTAADGGAVLDAMARQRPSLVLMDAGLPVMDGLNVLGILKADVGLRDVPVLLVTQEADRVSRERGIALGAYQCLFKPYRPLEIQRRLREIIDAREPEEETQRLPNGNDPLRIGDPLTQLGSASQLRISLDYEFTRAVRYKHALSCVVIACLNGKELSRRLPDTFIANLANTVKGAIRTVDHLFRSDELEFTVLLPETNQDGARIVVERLRTLLREHSAADAELRPRIAVASVSCPIEGVSDGDALYASARSMLM